MQMRLERQRTKMGTNHLITITKINQEERQQNWETTTDLTQKDNRQNTETKTKPDTEAPGRQE